MPRESEIKRLPDRAHPDLRGGSEIEDPVEVEEDLLIVENVTYLRGRDASKSRLEPWLIRFRDGEQTSLTLYQTKPEALEAAGLRE